MPKPVFYILTGIQLEENTEVLSFLPVLKQKQNTGFVSHYMFREQKEMQKKKTNRNTQALAMADRANPWRKERQCCEAMVCSSLVEPLALGFPQGHEPFPAARIRSRPALRPRQEAAAWPHSYLTPEVPSRITRDCTICHPEPTKLRCFPSNPHLA